MGRLKVVRFTPCFVGVCSPMVGGGVQGESPVNTPLPYNVIRILRDMNKRVRGIQ